MAEVSVIMNLFFSRAGACADDVSMIGGVFGYGSSGLVLSVDARFNL